MSIWQPCFKDLTLEEVFEKLGIQEHVSVFTGQGITMEELTSCSEEDLKVNGVHSSLYVLLLRYTVDTTQLCLSVILCLCFCLCLCLCLFIIKYLKSHSQVYTCFLYLGQIVVHCTVHYSIHLSVSVFSLDIPSHLSV